MTSIRRTWSLLLGAFLLASLGWGGGLTAQGTTTAALSGVVRAEGAPVVAAEVVVRNANTGATNRTLTNEDGRYFVPYLNPGSGYTVEVSALGYRTAREENITLSLGSVFELSFALIPQAVAAGEIRVTTSRGDVFSPSRMGAQTTLREGAIERQPTIDRHINDLAALSPYVSLTGDAPSIGGQNNRMNNIQIDGAVNNDVFGLADSGVPGGQADAKPISIDAIEQFEVLVAPFDVRQAGFSGGLINAVTKSGTNRWTGSLYGFFRNESFLNSELPFSVPGAGGVTLQDTLRTEDFLDQTIGFSLGGPIVQDRVHFFTAGELQQRQFPLEFGLDSDMAAIRQHPDSIQRFIDILENTYGLEAGDPGAYALENPSANFFGRVDWRLSDAHRATLRHNFVRASDDDSPSRRGFNFELSSATYEFESTTNSTVLQLHSTLGEETFNELLFNFQTIRDRRAPIGAYQKLNVFNISDIGATDPATGNLVAGAEFFSQANELDQDVVQLTDNFTRLFGDHRATIGAQYEFYKFRNLFAPGTLGEWDFGSLAELEAGDADEYFINTIFPGVDDVASRFSVHNISAYAQDEWTVTPQLTLTAGVRMDVPLLPDEPRANPDFTGSFDRRTDVVPSGNMLFSPRIGFNYQIPGAQVTQFRGGVGLFTGRPAFVWLSNQYGNTGRELLGLTCTGANVPAFTPDDPPVTCADGTGAEAAGVAIVNVFDEDFKFPQELKASLAVDRQLPWGVRASVEGLFTKAVNQIALRELNIVPVANAPAEAGIGDRPIYGTPVDRSFDAMRPNRVDTDFGPVVELTNASENYSYVLSFELERRFFEDIDLRGSYSFMRAFDTQSLTSSIATSNFGFNAIGGDPNNPELAPSNFDRPHKVLLSASGEFFEDFGGTRLTVFYVGQSGKPYSYMYDGDVNGDGYETFGVVNNRNNDLVYIPENSNEVTFRSADDERLFNELVELEPCLQEQSGQIMERNSCRAPWFNRLNMKLEQGLPLPTQRGRVKLTMDIFNVLNLLNQDWGLEQAPAFNTIDLLQLRGRDNVTGNMQFDYDGFSLTDENDVEHAILPYTTFFSSRWNIQAGVRLSF